ncbi:MAG TPA: GNAT family protein [Streptosporangiaceae bacterium]
MQQARVTRLITEDDATELAELLTASRAFLAPFEPERAPFYFTPDGQRAAIRNALASHAQGTSLPHVIRTGSGELAGRITLNGIVRGPFQSCSVGYWVGAAFTRRGLASAALRDIISIAFADGGQQGLGLHRIQAETLLDNLASQRVLARAGFSQIGMAPTYLKIAGRWQDMFLFQLINPAAD